MVKLDIIMIMIMVMMVMGRRTTTLNQMFMTLMMMIKDSENDPHVKFQAGFEIILESR